MFDFDNMGFTNTVEHIKFLSCGDCEVIAQCNRLEMIYLQNQVGPLGYHNLQTKKSYLALARLYNFLLLSNFALSPIFMLIFEQPPSIRASM